MVSMIRLVRPTGNQRVPLTSLVTSHWNIIDRERFHAAWAEQAVAAAARLDVQTVHVIIGLLLPGWSSLPDNDVRVWRLSTPQGQDMLARIIAFGTLRDLLDRFGLKDTARPSQEDLIAGVSQGLGVSLTSLNARLVEVRVNGSPRLEIRGFAADRLSWLKSIGCFTEIIAYKTRLFLPADRVREIMRQIMEAG
jgi:hypothetical protein